MVIAQQQRIRKWALRATALLAFALVGYILSYLPHRAAGDYQVTQTGELRYARGLAALSDLDQWSPDGCWWQLTFHDSSGKTSSRGNRKGYFYAPLIAIDRLFNFPDLLLFDPDTARNNSQTLTSPPLSLFLIHTA